jgi:hypothetical protein
MEAFDEVLQISLLTLIFAPHAWCKENTQKDTVYTGLPVCTIPDFYFTAHAPRSMAQVLWLPG